MSEKKVTIKDKRRGPRPGTLLKQARDIETKALVALRRAEARLSKFRADWEQLEKDVADAKAAHLAARATVDEHLGNQ